MSIEIKKILEATKGLADNTELRMGTKTRHHPGEVFFTGYNFEFDVDWNGVSSFDLNKLRELVRAVGGQADEDAWIVSQDVDDLSTIHFVDFIEIDGALILIHD